MAILEATSLQHQISNRNQVIITIMSAPTRPAKKTAARNAPTKQATKAAPRKITEMDIRNQEVQLEILQRETQLTKALLGVTAELREIQQQRATIKMYRGGLQALARHQGQR